LGDFSKRTERETTAVSSKEKERKMKQKYDELNYEFPPEKYDIDSEICDQERQDWEEITREYSKYLQEQIIETF
jgi:hypothetical protein